MRKVLIVCFILTMVLGVNAQKKKELTTAVEVNYCLPKVVYQLEVTMECTHCIPGPYWKYAEKELGMVPKIIRDEERWELKNIRVKPIFVPDEKAVYSISASTDYIPLTLTLSAEGFLAGVSAGEGTEVGNYGMMKYRNDEEEEVEYVDIDWMYAFLVRRRSYSLQTQRTENQETDSLSFSHSGQNIPAAF